MTSEPADALREQAREWGRALLAGTPWSGVSDRLSLLLVQPPARFEGSTNVTYWLTLDLAAARSLADPYGAALSSDRAVVEHPRAAGLNVTLVVMSDEAMHRYLTGTTPAAIEGRWQARHHEPIADRMRRGEQYALRANLLPDDAPERILRTLFLELVAAIRAIATLEANPAHALAAAGAATTAACRIACFDALAAADLAGLAQFDHAVDAHSAAGDQMFPGAAAVADAGQLQQLVQFDMVAVEFEADLGHR